MEDLTKSSLYCGILLFVMCSLLLIAKIPIVMAFVVLSPGIIMGALLINYTKGINPLISLLFIILSESIYFGCFYFLDLSNYSKWSGIRILCLSSAGATLLKLCYDLLISRYITTKKTFLWPSLIGVISALPSSLCAFFFDGGESSIQQAFYCGIFLIYPIWYYSFAAYINHCKRHIAVPENASNY